MELFEGFSVSPFALFEVQGEGRSNAVELGKTAFGEGPECFDAVDVGASPGEAFGLFADPDVPVVANIDQAVIAAPIVRIDNGRRIDPAPDHPMKTGLRAIRDDLGVDPAAALEETEDRLLLGAPAGGEAAILTALASRTEVALINFNLTDQTTDLSHLMVVDQPTETHEVSVRRVAAHTSKSRHVGRSKVTDIGSIAAAFLAPGE